MSKQVEASALDRVDGNFFQRRCEAEEIMQAVEAAGGSVNGLRQYSIGWTVGIRAIPEVWREEAEAAAEIHADWEREENGAPDAR